MPSPSATSFSTNPQNSATHLPPLSFGPAQFPLAAAVQFGRLSLIPAPDGDVINVEPSRSHHLLQVSEAEPKTQVPTDSDDDDLGLEMSPLKQFRPVRLHPSRRIKSAPIRFATLPPKVI